VSAIDTYDEVLEQLGRGDPIAAREQLKEKAVRFAQALEDQILVEPERGTTDVEQRDAFLAAVTQSAEELLAAALPLVEYGDSNDHAAIAQALQHVVDRGLSEERGGRIARASAVVAVARVVWALATYALTTRRIDALVALASVGTLRRYEGQPMLPIVDDRSYRYPDALGGNAGESYRDYHDWLGASGFRTSPPRSMERSVRPTYCSRCGCRSGIRAVLTRTGCATASCAASLYGSVTLASARTLSISSVSTMASSTSTLMPPTSSSNTTATSWRPACLCGCSAPGKKPGPITTDIEATSCRNPSGSVRGRATRASRSSHPHRPAIARACRVRSPRGRLLWVILGSSAAIKSQVLDR